MTEKRYFSFEVAKEVAEDEFANNPHIKKLFVEEVPSEWRFTLTYRNGDKITLASKK